ncbi:hypothetical protein EJ02DRAFT_419710 [Clathrospora elynae]|uniref:Uncharacterized protein n=1 Tax=Clathrospora elynae TaxID=706981 RepID=A0A6A5SZR2_9PLEO|nr:hypothetical protein EJ02DRAFT_419710 [Clathrospora elynae]
MGTPKASALASRMSLTPVRSVLAPIVEHLKPPLCLLCDLETLCEGPSNWRVQPKLEG